MIKKLNFKFLIFTLAIVFASVYLTFIVDVYTLNTALKRIFVFCYFIVASYLAVKCCILLRIHKHKIAYAIAALLAIVTLIFAQNTFLPTEKEHVFYIQSITQEESEHGHITLSEITIDGKTQKLSGVNFEASGNWSYTAQDDNFEFTPSGPSNDNLISISVIGKNVTFSFESQTTPTHVRIFDNYEFDNVISLTDIDESKYQIDYTANVEKEYSIAERLIYNAGAVVTMTFVYKIFIELLLRLVKKIGKTKVAPK